jgi:hypothetical protein
VMGHGAITQKLVEIEDSSDENNKTSVGAE